MIEFIRVVYEHLSFIRPKLQYPLELFQWHDRNWFWLLYQYNARREEITI